MGFFDTERYRDWESITKDDQGHEDSLKAPGKTEKVALLQIEEWGQWLDTEGIHLNQVAEARQHRETKLFEKMKEVIKE
jgi:hypothetical protein